MAALHDALKTLGPLDFTENPLDDLKPFLTSAFSAAQLIVDSVPIPDPSPSSSPSPPEGRSRSASSASEISLSSARTPPPEKDVEALQKEWKSVKMGAKENPLGMNVYKLGGKDGKGAWFARRSVHEGLGFSKWKRGLEREFPETMKVQGGPGEGNIRGIGGEKRVAFKDVEGVGKMEVYLLSAQFPGPTAPRDFVTMFMTSDQALEDKNGEGVPRHFMVISRPCTHPDTPQREGYIRGQYESVEFIREVPVKKGPTKSASTTNLESTGKSRNRSASTLGREAVLRNAKNHHSAPTSEHGGESPPNSSEADLSRSESTGRARGKTISFDKSRGSEARGEEMDVPREDDESEENPIEWIMITRSDPGGSVPRFMIERGTPGGIVSDASKFLNWACAKDMEDLESDSEEEGGKGEGNEQHQEQKAQKHEHRHNHEKDLHNWQTNGHLAGIEEAATPTEEKTLVSPESSNGSGLYAMVAGAAGAAGGYITSHTPAIISDHLPHMTEEHTNGTSSTVRRDSLSSISSVSSVGSFASALETRATHTTENGDADASSMRTTDSTGLTVHDKELQKLEEKKKKLDEKLNKAREKEESKNREDTAKEEEAVKKAQEKHEREVKKQEEKYRKEVEKLEKKKEKEARKAEDKKRKQAEKDDKVRLMRELEETKAEVGVLRKEKEILRGQVGDLQAENTALAARIGKLGGDEALRGLREDVGKAGRMRASSLKGLTRVGSFKSGGPVGEKDKENNLSILSAGSGGSS